MLSIKIYDEHIVQAKSSQKSLSIYSALESRIRSGEWAVGDLLPKEMELAAEYECGRYAISQAVTRLIQEGLVERRKRAGTRVLRTTKAGDRPAIELDAYACVFPSEKHEGIGRMLRGFHEASLETGRRLVMLPTGLDFRRETELLASLAEFDVRGAIACPVTASPQDQLNVQTLLLKSRVPVVLMGAYLPGFSSGAVHLDNFSAGYTMTKYLVDKGLRRIGFLANWSWVEFIRERFAGFEWAMREAGLEVPKESVFLANAMHANLGDPVAEPEAIAAAFLAQRPQVDAVVCADDFLAAGLVRAARRLGLRVPKDLKVTGMDNMAISREDGVPITTLEVPFEAIGRQSFQLLDGIVTGSIQPGADIKVFGTIVARESA